MRDNRNFLAFDCGATSCRAVLGILCDNKLEIKEIYRFPNIILEKDGKFFWDVENILQGFKDSLKKIALEGIAIDSIGVDTWGVDFACIAKDGSLIEAPRSYRDPYTAGIPEEVFKIVPREELYASTGIQIMDFNTIFQLYALSKEKPSVLERCDKILFMPDFLSYLLTGEKITEYTDASTSGMLNQNTSQFEKSILERLGIDTSILMDVSAPGCKVGYLKEDIALETGIERIPVIAVAGHDTASAIAAVPASDEHFAYLSSGTWSLMGIESSTPIINEDSCSRNFTNEGGIDGTTRFLKNITGMWLIEQCRKVWNSEGREYSYDELVKLAKEAKDFPSRINPDDTRFASPQNMVEAIKSYLIDTKQQIPQNDAQMASLIYNSLAERYKEVLEMLQDFADFDIETLHVIGGGAANDYMSQLTADTINKPVVAGPVEATAIGNIMMQARAAGVVRDRWDMRSIIADSFSVKTFTPNNIK